ncbi:hypothetical protein [Breoghania sp.]|uniref:hypothetical protein n=1 Tax=Breoghania sp. TaxID=2065378 RepID=UPI002AA89A1F|nr:hypothetical protein [Breoghania sp.]
MAPSRRRGPINPKQTEPRRRPAHSGLGWALQIPLDMFHGLRNDLAHYWKLIRNAPLQTLAALVSFIFSSDTLAGLLFGGSSSGGNHAGFGLVESLLRLPAGRLLVFSIATCSIGWLLALVTAPLSRTRDDGLRVIGVGVTALCGLFLTMVGQQILPAPKEEPDAKAFALTVIGIAAATLIIQVYFALRRDMDPLTIERRATLILTFSGVALVSALVTFGL